MDLTKLFLKHRKGILLSIALVAIENVAWIIEPTVFGNVIDAFIDKSISPGAAAFVLPLSIWIGVFLVNSGVGALRRSLDQRIYLRMFTNIATEVARIGIERNLSVSRTAARAELSREYMTFLQYRLPEIIEQAIAIGGAVIALFFFDWRIALTCALVIPPLIGMSLLYNRRVSVRQQDLHDGREETYEIFSTQNVDAIRQHYTKAAANEQAIANWGALNFGAIRVCLLAIFLVVLYIAIDLDDFTTGNIYSIVAYLWTFVASTEYLPELLQSTGSIRDISRRIRTDPK